jgi:protein-tyrosine phosphatase
MGLLHWIRKSLGTEDEVFLPVPIESIRGRLFVSPMPHGPYDKYNQVLKRYREEGVEFAAVLVTEDEIRRKCKRDLRELYRKAGIEMVHLPIQDLTSPELEGVLGLVRHVGPYLRAGARVAVHCNAGTGRSAVVVACLRAALDGQSGLDAIAWVEGLMTTQMTTSQKRVVERFAEAWRHEPNAVAAPIDEHDG